MSSTRPGLIWLAIGLLAAAVIVLLLQIGSATNAVVTIEWTTASELNTAGFNLYRSENKTGPYTRLNAEMIPGSTDPFTGGNYIFTDTQVSAGRTYYYQLEDMETSGNSTRHEPYEVLANANLGSNIYLAVGLLGAAFIAGFIGLSSKKTIAHV